jgi:hypothetical protein
MSLASMVWKRVSVHEVVAEFLLGERHRLAGAFSSPSALRLITSANTSDPLENHSRLRLLHLIRRALIGEIPPDTRWYEVRNLTDNQLPELHVLARSVWDAPGQDKNELFCVAARRRPQRLSAQPSSWHSPILWGHDKAGPFTIIEGNNRLVAYAGTAARGIAIPVLIGLSPSLCLWHIFRSMRRDRERSLEIGYGHPAAGPPYSGRSLTRMSSADIPNTSASASPGSAPCRTRALDQLVWPGGR